MKNEGKGKPFQALNIYGKSKKILNRASGMKSSTLMTI